ncbi:hypothetical protein POTOM_023299 [Populus tomentosa]|uniref:NAC domain-containing protein n=1 Tax=Populus tomentosa TaxID=118781 RepID=A0A8X8D0R4_POPTO|nr:hypothetical protein POTOM_023299 [Populus tomentosa]
MKTAVAMINLSPSVPLDFDVPNRVWKGKDVSYAHLRVFGCRAFVHVPRDERSKLDSKTKQCIFLGSEDDEFGYRLWDPKEKKIVRSRDVIFFEDQTIEDFEQKEKTESTTFIPSNSNPIPTPQLPLMPANHGGDLQNDDNGGFLNEPLVGDVESTNDEIDIIPEQVMQEAPDEPQLRRSTRPRQPSTKYSPHEYVVLSPRNKMDAKASSGIQLPPGFRFHPSDEELIVHYLKNRVSSSPLPASIIAEIDLYKYNPWELPSLYILRFYWLYFSYMHLLYSNCPLTDTFSFKIEKALFGVDEWYFFTPRDRKYPNGARPNRAAASGYWKATGTDTSIKSLYL